MFKDKNKKYTMEEFKDMFEEVEKKVIEDTMNDKNIDNPMTNMMVGVVTMKALNDIKTKLFNGEGE